MNRFNPSSSLGIRRQFLVAATGLALALLAQAPKAAAFAVDQRIKDAKTVATAEVDIENVTEIARNTGIDIGSGQIPLTTDNVKALGSYMASAIIAKTAPAGALAITYNNTNKVDEIGEVGAYVIRQVAENTDFKTKLTNAKAMTLALLRGVLSKPKTNTALLAKNVIKDVVGSVSLTIFNTDVAVLNSTKKTKIKEYLLANAALIAGSANTVKVKAAINQGFSGTVTANKKYEDGNLFTTPQVVDPETDIRNG